MADSESDNEDNPEKNQRSWFAERFGSADAWTAAATIFLVIVGIWGVKETKHTLELSERAWITATGGNTTKPPEKTKGIHFAISFQNSGREPATDVHFRFQNSTIDAYDSEFTDMTNVKVEPNTACGGLMPEKGRGVIPPNATFAWIYDTLRGEPAFVADDAIINGTKFLVLNGCVAYQTFEEIRRTSFCYIVEAAKPSAVPQNITVILNPGGNPGQPPLAVPIQPNASPDTGRIYTFAPCSTGFGSE